MASFSIPLSGLTAAQEQLQSISNNLSNIGTVGYKDQNVNFSDVFAQATMTDGAGDPIQIGSGVATASTTYDFTTGSQTATGIASNMALNGTGFFVTKSPTGQDNYTRAGDFTVNNSGELVAPDGGLVLGYPAVGGVVNTSAALQPIQVGSANSPAVATTSFQINANLDSSTAVGSTGGSSTLQVYDSLGQAHTLSVQYTNEGNNTWSYSVTIPSADLSSGGTGTTQIASGTLNFDSSGKLQLGTPPTTSIGLNMPTLADGAASMSLSWDLADSSGNPLLTQTASASTTSATSQNGYASGTLSSYTVQPDGTVEGTFSSGATVALGQVAVATFANQQGLASNGNNDYQATIASGGSVIGVAGAGGRGTIVGGSVEASNVDLANEFGKMIVAQQAYSANAKSITAFNQVSQTTISMIQ